MSGGTLMRGGAGRAAAGGGSRSRKVRTPKGRVLGRAQAGATSRTAQQRADRPVHAGQG